MALGRLARPPGLAAATAVQVAGLTAWLGLRRTHSASAPEGLLGVAALVAGLFLGVILTDRCVRGLSSRLPLARSLALALTEAALWVGWLATARLVDGPTGVVVASTALAIVLLPLRYAEANLLAGDRPLGGRVGPTTLWAGGVAGTGAAAWLGFVAFGPALLDALGAGTASAAGAPRGTDLVGVGTDPGPAAGLLDPPQVVGLAALAVATLVGRVLVVRTARR